MTQTALIDLSLPAHGAFSVAWGLGPGASFVWAFVAASEWETGSPGVSLGSRDSRDKGLRGARLENKMVGRGLMMSLMVTVSFARGLKRRLAFGPFGRLRFKLQELQVGIYKDLNDQWPGTRRIAHESEALEVRNTFRNTVLLVTGVTENTQDSRLKPMHEATAPKGEWSTQTEPPTATFTTRGCGLESAAAVVLGSMSMSSLVHPWAWAAWAWAWAWAWASASFCTGIKRPKGVTQSHCNCVLVLLFFSVFSAALAGTAAPAPLSWQRHVHSGSNVKKKADNEQKDPTQHTADTAHVTQTRECSADVLDPGLYGKHGAWATVNSAHAWSLEAGGREGQKFKLQLKSSSL